ncbi:MAG TPA: 2-C-methyl-D-erythritol 4-phosphate cytidylyltransferase [Candidatus Kapabacteria bacterium]|nr:2-C-methyl-D-erythritol 4-phosphate cytidylyltransferase [Candidatus Kapabacteria bacterium]
MRPFSVIIPAAGSGSRSGRALPKQYVELAGAPILAHTIAAFLALESCVDVVVAIDEAWRDVATACAPDDPRVRFVGGGAERQHSIAAALAELRGDARHGDALHGDTLPGDASIVLVHDAARPCVGRALIERVVEAAATHGAAVPVVAVAETVKRIDANGMIVGTIPRSELRLAQTPQGFERALLERAYSNAEEHRIVATDDASLVEALGVGVAAVEGDADNLKITLPGDFERAAAILKAKGRIV